MQKYLTIEDKQKWALHIDRMKRRDNRSEEDIKKLLKFCTNDSFWQSNVLSTDKLRKQFDTLYMQMCKPKSNKNDYANYLDNLKEL